MKKGNQIADKSKVFAIRIIRLYKYLTSEKKENILSRQILRSGTSIGANIREALSAQSTADFIAKMQIALKETSETEYWLELLTETEYITEKAAESIAGECQELIKMITAIVKTGKKNDNNS